MCGICGKIYFSPKKKVESETIQKMMKALAHRGPDENGMHISDNLGLGHTRLSIIDLSGGSQPIYNEDGSIVVIFNGEIYNFHELRKELLAKGHIFKTNTDTEVIVHLYEEYAEDFVKKLNGMFAIALWDNKQKTLFLVRDRVGIKPLYFYQSTDCLIFASEIKAILQDPQVSASANPLGILKFLKFYYPLGSDTIFNQIYKLDSGHYLKIKNGKIYKQKYWDLNFTKSNANDNINKKVEELSELINKTTKEHMISDVPIGFLLSGGVDSTALLSYAVNETDKKVYSFTMGFDGHNFADERKYAKLAADKFGTEHFDMTIGAKDFETFLPEYIWYMDEPVCEPPAIALYFITKLAKDYVKVLLSGEGGDEAFAGYQNYRNFNLFEKFKNLSGPFNPVLKNLVTRMNSLVKSDRIDKYIPLFGVQLQDYYYSRSSTPFNFFNNSQNNFFKDEFINGFEVDNVLEDLLDHYNNFSGSNDLDKMLYIDSKTWLPDDLLIKADKMTMANSVELRVPLLDHNVLEFAADLPIKYKVKGLNSKHILKKTFSKQIPKEIIKRKKTGFPVPYSHWLNNELKDYVSDILLDRKTVQRGYFKRDAIESLIKSNRINNNYSPEIFSLVVLELWHRQFLTI